MSQSTMYQIILRLDLLREHLERGGSINCTDIAARFDVSTRLLNDTSTCCGAATICLCGTIGAWGCFHSIWRRSLAATADPFQLLVDRLKQEDRIKVGCDYALARKHQKTQLLCQSMYRLATIAEY